MPGGVSGALAFAKGKVGSIIAKGWEWGYSLDPKVGNPSLASKIGAYPMPSHTPGKYMPTFLGGSDLAVPVTSKNKTLAADWIKAFTSTTSMRALATAGGVIPNTTTLVSINSAGTAAANGVIQIQTKKGRSGRTDWRVYGQYGQLEDPTAYPDNYYTTGLNGTSGSAAIRLGAVMPSARTLPALI